MALSGNNLFVANYNSGTVGEYTTSGQTINANLITGLDEPQGLTVFDNHLYVTEGGNGTVGEWTTSGDVVNATLITGLNDPVEIVVVPEPSSIALAVLGVAVLFRRRIIQAMKSRVA